MPDFGNWMASSVDMVKLLTAIDGSRMPGISQDSFNQMIAPLPPPMQNNPNGSHFGLGLDTVRLTPEGVTYSKNGGKPGVHAQIIHLPNHTDFLFAAKRRVFAGRSKCKSDGADNQSNSNGFEQRQRMAAN